MPSTDFSLKDIPVLSPDELRKQANAVSVTSKMQIRASIPDNAQKALETMLDRAGVPKRFVDKSFRNFNANSPGQQTALKICSRYAKNFSQAFAQGTGLVLTGESGTGKTHLAASILQTVMPNRSGLFITVSEMLRAIRGTYAPSSKKTEQELFANFIKIDLLVLDEVGVAIGDDEKRKALIFDVINGRYNCQKPTIIIGNLNPKEMKDYLSDRTWRRITANKAPTVVFDWPAFEEGQ